MSNYVEPSPSNREDDFLARARYDLETALKIGSRLANEGLDESTS